MSDVESAAAVLRAAGWLVVPPNLVAGPFTPPADVSRISVVMAYGPTCVRGEVTLPPGVPEPQTITVTKEMVARGAGGAGGVASWSSEPLAIKPGETVTVRVGGGAA